MKTKLLSVALGFLCSLALLTGCNEDKNNTPPEPPLPTGPQNVTIATSAILYDGVTVAVTPKTDDLTYHCSYVESSVINEYAEDEDYISVEIAKMMKGAEFAQKSFADYVTENGLIVSGQSTFTVEANLDAGTEYCVYAYLLDADGKYAQTMDKVFFTTPAAPAVVIRDDVKLTMDAASLDVHAFAIAVYCSDPKIFLFTGYMTIADYESKFGGKTQEIVDYVETAFANSAKDQGVTVGAIARVNCLQGSPQIFGELSGAPASTPYIAYAIGFDSQGRRVTEIAHFEYSTLEEILASASVKLTPGKFYDGNELIAIDDQKYKAYQDKAYALFYAEPSEDAVDWFVRAGKLEGLKDQPDDILKDLALQKGAKNLRTLAFAAQWDTDYMLLGVAVDADELAGALVKEVMKCEKSKVSPISDIVDAPARASVFELIGSELVGLTKGGTPFDLKLKTVEKIRIR